MLKEFTLDDAIIILDNYAVKKLRYEIASKVARFEKITRDLNSRKME